MFNPCKIDTARYFEDLENMFFNLPLRLLRFSGTQFPILKISTEVQMCVYLCM